MTGSTPTITGQALPTLTPSLSLQVNTRLTTIYQATSAFSTVVESPPTPNPTKSGNHTNEPKPLAIGLGLGLGIPFLALACFFCRAYRRISITFTIGAPEPPPSYEAPPTVLTPEIPGSDLTLPVKSSTKVGEKGMGGEEKKGWKARRR